MTDSNKTQQAETAWDIIQKARERNPFRDIVINIRPASENTAPTENDIKDQWTQAVQDVEDTRE